MEEGSVQSLCEGVSKAWETLLSNHDNNYKQKRCLDKQGSLVWEIGTTVPFFIL